MRISDWSSDVCSSDLVNSGSSPFCVLYGTNPHFDDALLQELYPHHVNYVLDVQRSARSALRDGFINLRAFLEMLIRSEARSVGKECVSTFISRWAPYH